MGLLSGKPLALSLKWDAGNAMREREVRLKTAVVSAMLAGCLSLVVMMIAIPNGNTEESEAVNNVPSDNVAAIKDAPIDKIVTAEAAIYMDGANSPAHRQFDFLIGCWDVEATKMSPQGGRVSYLATWEAKYLNDKRVVIDDYRTLRSNGEEAASYLTLRTYSPQAKRWAFAGIGVHSSAAAILEWSGAMVDAEMQLHAKGLSHDGTPVLNNIRFYDIEDHQFKWESNMSFDDGASWVNVGALVAKKRNNAC